MLKAIDDRTINVGEHTNCEWSCPCKVWSYIETLEDPQFLLQDLVKEGGKKVKNENEIRVRRTVQGLEDDQLFNLLQKVVEKRGKKLGKNSENKVIKEINTPHN